MRRISYLIILIFLLLSACKKEKAPNAKILNYGSIIVGGCGWLIEIEGVLYRPENLETEYPDFLFDGLLVDMKYEILDKKSSCGFIVLEEYQHIEIVKMKKNE